MKTQKGNSRKPAVKAAKSPKTKHYPYVEAGPDLHIDYDGRVQVHCSGWLEINQIIQALQGIMQALDAGIIGGGLVHVGRSRLT